MLKPSDLQFADTLDLGTALALTESLNAALSAMADFGSREEHRMTVAALLLVAQSDLSSALNRKVEK